MWAIQVTLDNGDTRLLGNSSRTAEEAAAELMEFEAGAGAFSADWLHTQEGWVIPRSRILDARIVRLP